MGQAESRPWKWGDGIEKIMEEIQAQEKDKEPFAVEKVDAGWHMWKGK